MRGFATVKLPGAGSIGADGSYLWIAINAAVALAAGAVLTIRLLPLAGAALVLVAVMGAAYLFRADGGWWALALFAGLAWLAARWRAARQ